MKIGVKGDEDACLSDLEQRAEMGQESAGHMVETHKMAVTEQGWSPDYTRPLLAGVMGRVMGGGRRDTEAYAARRVGLGVAN